MAAADVEAACRSAFISVPHDCNLFLKAVALPPSPPAGAPTLLFDVQPFVGGKPTGSRRGVLLNFWGYKGAGQG
jgi:hypothetical protein